MKATLLLVSMFLGVSFAHAEDSQINLGAAAADIGGAAITIGGTMDFVNAGKDHLRNIDVLEVTEANYQRRMKALQTARAQLAEQLSPGMEQKITKFYEQNPEAFIVGSKHNQTLEQMRLTHYNRLHQNADYLKLEKEIYALIDAHEKAVKVRTFSTWLFNPAYISRAENWEMRSKWTVWSSHLAQNPIPAVTLKEKIADSKFRMGRGLTILGTGAVIYGYGATHLREKIAAPRIDAEAAEKEIVADHRTADYEKISAPAPPAEAPAEEEKVPSHISSQLDAAQDNPF